MVYPQTSSPIGENKTRTSLSTNIIIKIGNNPVGAVQKLDITESRQITMIDEVGTDGHIDGAPTKSTTISGNCSRIRFNRMRIAEAFSRGFLHAHAQRIPFNIDIIEKWSNDDNASIVTTLTGVWINKISYSFGSSDFIITDDMSFEAQAISSMMANTNAARGGTTNMPLQIDTIERTADVGLRRGSMDSDYLNAFFAQ